MLKVNVGLSRKLSRDYQSTGFSVNLEGEVASPINDPEGVIAEVRRFYDLAEESLNRQIDGHQSEGAIASRDEEPQPRSARNGKRDELATNKQIQYLLSIGKRMRLSTTQLEREIETILGEVVGVYDLSKRQAGTVIDTLTNAAARDR